MRRLGGRAELGFDISPRKDTNGPASGKWSAAGAEPAAGAIAPSRTKPDPLSAHNDLLRAQDASLYSRTGMECAGTGSLYSGAGMECARTRYVPCRTWNVSPRTRSLYARTGMELARTGPVPCRTWNVSPRAGSNGGHAKRVDLAANAG